MTITGALTIAAVTAPHPATIDTAAALQIVKRLQERFPSTPAASIHLAVDRAASRLAGARVTQYLPVLIERMARDELARGGRPVSERPTNPAPVVPTSAHREASSARRT
jgi:hypothetical protein